MLLLDSLLVMTEIQRFAEMSRLERSIDDNNSKYEGEKFR